jgi:hypothetical protein
MITSSQLSINNNILYNQQYIVNKTTIFQAFKMRLSLIITLPDSLDIQLSVWFQQISSSMNKVLQCLTQPTTNTYCPTYNFVAIYNGFATNLYQAYL